ncbi:MAG: HEAT repeat domain-containing protein [Planctomycetota bacterium]|jgi:hypothetical protein
MRLSVFVLPLGFLLSAACLADEIVLKDGRKLYGEVRKEGDHTVVVDAQGNSVVLKDEVSEIKTTAQMQEEYKNILERYGDAPPEFQMGCWCWKRGLFEQARGHFRKVVEKDPENRGARWALGHLKVRGIWVEQGVWTRLPGKKKAWVRWIPGVKKGKLQVRVGEEPNETRDLVRDAVRGDAENREKAEKALNALPRAARTEGLQLALMDPSSTVRKYAARRLCEGSGLETARGLTRAALSDPVRDVRKIALGALKEGKFPDAVPFLIGGLTSKRFPVRLNALNALGDFPARETVEALLTVMEKSVAYGGSPRVNLFSGRQWGYIRDFDVEVAQFIEVGDPIVATGMDGIVLDVRVMYAKEYQAGVQANAARRSLCQIAGKDFGRNVEVWRKWAAEKYGS